MRIILIIILIIMKKKKERKKKVLRAETNEYRYGSNSGNSSAGVV